jgi:hypothetical protein
MAVYGKFETIDAVFRTNHGSIWTARMVGTSDAADCCVKLIELNQDMLTQRDTSVAKNLLVAAALQQAMGNKSEFWAPVYGLGSQGTNAFYAGRFFPRSLQTLIDNRTALTATELKIILLAILDGLLDLETAVGRAHSNLKPSNILIDDATQIRPGSIFLCDPDPSSEAPASSSRTPDIKAVGQLLYALVTHKPYFTARFPLPASEKWKELGSTGRQWRALCENLLHLGPRRGVGSIEAVRERVDAIQPTRRRMPVAALLMFATIAGLTAAGYVNREQLPGWYAVAHDKVLALVGRKPKKSSPHTGLAFMSADQKFKGDRSSGSSSGSSSSAVFSSSTQTASAKLNPGYLYPLPGVSTTQEVAAGPEPLPAAAPASTMPSEEAEALKVIQQTDSPDFHSESAKAEFIHNRDQYVSAHYSAPSTNLLIDWEKIRSRVQAIDAQYPAMDAASTTGWPTGLASVMNARRDAMLVQAIDSAFVQQPTDPTHFQETLHRVQLAGNAVVAAHDSLARGDISTSEKAIAACNSTLRQFPSSDADLADLFAPAKKEFSALDEVENTADRAALLEIADNNDAALAVRLSAWLHLTSPSMSSNSTDPWPTDFAALAADQVRADKLTQLLQEAGSVDIVPQVTGAEANRQTGFFSRLRDQASVLSAVRQAGDPQYASLLAKAPVWFRYDLALYALQSVPANQVTAEQKKAYTDLAGQVDAPGMQMVHDALKADDEHPPTLPRSGPGALKDWQIRAGWTRDHCTFISKTTGDSLEFLRVHVGIEPAAVDCYLCTTETPVAFMQHLLQGDAAALSTAETLNAATPSPGAQAKGGMRLWSFDDKNIGVNLDEDDYRKCFVVSPTDQLPLQFVTPQTAFYLARRVGCRLPTSREWIAALSQAKNSADENVKGFATLGWKLRDREYARLLDNPNRDPDFWPDDHIFLGDLDPAKVQRQSGAAIWTAAELSRLGGSTTSSGASAALWPLSTLQTSSSLGFRGVGDIENYAGVFHDLIGNVGEYVMDVPVVLSEKVSVNPPLSGAEAAGHVSDWFSPQRLAAVAVIGGSALSPPDLDPTKPYPLPKDANQFADVGFRLAFTDPISMPNALREVIGQATFLTAP